MTARILVVEDNPDCQFICSSVLSRAGYQTLVAADGEEAVEKAREEWPDLVVLDLGLPRLDGWAAARLLRAAPATREIPVLATSAYVLPDSRERCLAVGCDDFLPKPFTAEDLRTKVQSLLNRPRTLH